MLLLPDVLVSRQLCRELVRGDIKYKAALLMTANAAANVLTREILHDILQTLQHSVAGTTDRIILTKRRRC